MFGKKKNQGNEEILDLVNGDSSNKKKKGSTKKVVIITVISILVVIIGCVVGAYIYFTSLYHKESVDDIIKMPTDVTGGAVSAVTVPDLKKDSNIINILLIGEEAMAESTTTVDPDNTRGRSDCNVVLTINRKKKTAKLISFLRDTYVQIPGYQDNKLNAAYELGGGPLVQDVLKLNFHIVTDGYIRVNFRDFKKVIDALGGIEIELSETEAEYLNNTNYIAKAQYRTMKKGVNHLNGNQALGYCRIRRGKNYEAVLTVDGLANDWGRTARQRNVLNAIFNKYKEKSVAELVPIATELLPLVTTNMDQSQLLSILGVAMDLNLSELETMSVPNANEYTPFRDGSRVVDALKIDFTTMNEKIAKFMGTTAAKMAETVGTEATPVASATASPLN